MITIDQAGLCDEFHIAHAGQPCTIWTRSGPTHYEPGWGQFLTGVTSYDEITGQRMFASITTVNAGDFHTLAACPRARSDQSDNPPSPGQFPLSLRDYDALGYDSDGYDADGYNQDGYDSGGYDRNGLDADGYTRKQTQDSGDLDLAELWAQFAGSRSMFISKADAFLAHLREIVRDPGAIDEIEFCGSCGDPAWDEDVSSAGNGTRLCESCWEDWNTCDSCEEKYPADDLTEVASGAYVCDRCLSNNYTWCDGCEGYYPDDEDHDHASGDDGCESPQMTFTIRNDGCEPLASDTRFTITLPAGTISVDGLWAIKNYLQQQGLYDLSYDLDALGDQWQTRDGNYAKRLSRHAYKRYQVSLTPEILSQVGCIARDHSNPVSTAIEVTRDLNQSDEDFGNPGSCWWGGYSESRCALKTNGGFGLRSFDGYGNVTGRAWVLPLKTGENGKLGPTFETMTPDAFVVFNGYGDLSGYTGARIMAHMTGWTYRKVGYDDDTMYVNAGGYLIAPEDIAEKYTDGSFRTSLHQHSDLFENERELVNV